MTSQVRHELGQCMLLHVQNEMYSWAKFRLGPTLEDTGRGGGRFNCERGQTSEEETSGSRRWLCVVRSDRLQLRNKPTSILRSQQASDKKPPATTQTEVATEGRRERLNEERRKLSNT